MTDDWDAWLSSQKTTNRLLGLLIVVVAAGFISLDDGYVGLQIVAELLLGLVLTAVILLFLGWLVREPNDRDTER